MIINTYGREGSQVDTIYTPYQSIHDVSIIIHRGVIAEVRDAGGMPSDVDLRGFIHCAWIH